MNNQTRYTRLCKTLSDVGTFVPADRPITEFIDNYDLDYYRSVYLYTAAQKASAEEIIEIDGKMRARGVSGVEDLVTNSLVFDFDSGTNLAEAKSDALKLCSRLESRGIPKDAIQTYFSGNKGFSVEVAHDTDLTPPEFKSIVYALADDLDTFDHKIWNASRIFRVPFTRHPVSGLYKTPIFMDELVISEPTRIKDIAAIQCEPEVPPSWGVTPLPAAIKLLKKPKKEKVKVTDLHLDLNFDRKPRWLSKWKYAIQCGYFPNGCRSYAMEILAATYKAQGFTKDLAFNMLKGVADRQYVIHGGDKYTDGDIKNTNIRTVFSESWRGGTYSEDSFPPELKRYLIELGIPAENQNVDDNSMYSAKELMQKFKQFAKTANFNRMRFGLPELDEEIRFQTGQLHGLLAGPGVGKSSFAFTLLNNTSLAGVPSIFFSLDMSYSDLMLRITQRETGAFQGRIYSAYENDEDYLTSSYESIIDKQYKNVNFCLKSGISIEDLRRTIQETDESTGIVSKLIIIDYAEKIRTNFTEATAAMSHAVDGLHSLAVDMDKCVVVLFQPSRSETFPYKPITNYKSAKGSSMIEQAVTSLITACRPGYGTDEDDYFCINVVKNRTGKCYGADFHWQGLTGKIRPLEGDEPSKLEDLRARRKEEENDKAKNNRGGF